MEPSAISALGQEHARHSAATPLRLGAVSFANTRPLVWALEESRGHDLQLTFDHPAALAQQLRDGRIDVGLIPVAEALRGVGECAVAGVSIASVGPVWSVKLLGPVLPGAERHELRRVGVDFRSRSSVALLRILLGKLVGPEVDFERIDPLRELDSRGWPLRRELDAALVIGDRALEFSGGWDLGEEWTRRTGLPFVYALWMARSSDVAAAVGPCLRAARDLGLARIDHYLRRDPVARGVEREFLARYLTEAIDYRLRERHRLGIVRYAQLMGLERQLQYESRTGS
jgi:chorismate dehydratase